MFSVKWFPRDVHNSNSLLGQISYKEQSFCRVRLWGLGSCAEGELFNLDWYDRGEGTEKTEKLVQFLKTLATSSDLKPELGYKPQEFLFLLSSAQLAIAPQKEKYILKSPYVKKIDTWTNKSHGSNTMSLFRLSCQKDFK